MRRPRFLTTNSLPHLLIVTIATAHSGELHEQLVSANQMLTPASSCTMTTTGTQRVIEANGIPTHPVGAFPNRRNPHTIREQRYYFRIPSQPDIADQPTPLIRQPFGIALNGVLFDPGTAEYYQRDRNSKWNYEALSGQISLGLDENHAHVQPNGAYHYHGLPTALFNERSGGNEQMTLLGWAADGFPIYGLFGYKDPYNASSEVTKLKSSYRVKLGKRGSTHGAPGGKYDGTFTIDYEYVQGLGDLDECGGRFGVTPEFTSGTYYYVLTDDYPFIPRMFRGIPDPSFERRRGRGNRRSQTDVPPDRRPKL